MTLDIYQLSLSLVLSEAVEDNIYLLKPMKHVRLCQTDFLCFHC